MAQTNNPSGSGLTTRAVMWTGATGNPITDLNSLLPPSSGWILNQAISINDNGFIIGYGSSDGLGASFLLYPDRKVN